MRTPRPVSGCHQCWTSPSRNWRAAASENVRARQFRRRIEKRHRILQLIAEAERAARLIERGAPPEAAAQRLVQQPAIEQQIGREQRRVHLQRAEHRVPPVRGLQRARFPPASARRIAGYQLARVFDTRSLAQQEDDLGLVRRVRESTATWSAAAGIERRCRMRLSSATRRMRGRPGSGAVAPEELRRDRRNTKWRAGWPRRMRC